MMTVPMDKSSAPSPRELADRLYKKNLELEASQRKLAIQKVPSDPNTWYQIRENYEAIILEDHEFSEKHDVELSLWLLHHKRIEEFRSKLNNARSAGSVTSQGARTPFRPDSIKKIRSNFKSFLSESTGFYHDLIFKIRAKFGLPLGFFSDGSESQISLTKDEKKSAEMRKGLMSCHRSLIYLGDLARYKGSYGEGDSVSLEFAAASSYYKQAASLCPSSGNPHHQLAILASYTGDDLVSIYRYFRSLAADIPFSTARDNLIIAFEKNRQNFCQLPSNGKPPAVRTLPAQPNGRGRGRGDTRLLSKDSKPEGNPVKERQLSIPDILKAFSIRFVRINGILFTRTSLETFGEIFSVVKSDLLELLSSGPEEELNFGQDCTENGLFLVRLIAILIFSVHNVNKESDGQSYAEILQRTVLLQNAFIAAFEFAGHIVRRCAQLHDSASSFLLPASLVFIEWLASHPEIAAGSDVEEKQASARAFFWNQFVIFMNKLTASGLVAGSGDEDETCFSDMGRYDEEETGNRLALWEDLELRGFLPLVPAQLILDFSRKHSYGADGSEKEKHARVQRILAAGRALMNVVRVDQKAMHFDPCLKKFVLAVLPPVVDDYSCGGLSGAPKSNVTKQAGPVENASDYGALQNNAQLYADGDDEEEEIVFKPAAGEKGPSVSEPPVMMTAQETIQPTQASANGNWASTSMPVDYEAIQLAQTSSNGEWVGYGAQMSVPAHSAQFPVPVHSAQIPVPVHSAQIPMPVSNFQMSSGLYTSVPLDAAAVNFCQQSPPPMNLNTSKWLMDQAVLSNGLRNLDINGNGLLANHGLQEGLSSLQSSAFAFSPLISSSALDPLGRSFGPMKVADALVPSTLDSIVPSGVTSDGLVIRSSGALLPTSRKAPVSRPVRHLGPPPGFNNITPRPLDDPSLESAVNGRNPQIDDYSWLDGYHSSSTTAMGMENPVNHVQPMYQLPTTDVTANLNGPMSFPFPGKQTPMLQPQVANEKWREFQLFEHLKPNSEKQDQQVSFQPSMMPEQHQAQSLWSDYFV